MYCTHCGKTQPENAVFCPFCGKPRAVSPGNAQNKSLEGVQPPSASATQSAKAFIPGPSADGAADRQWKQIPQEDRDASTQPFAAPMQAGAGNPAGKKKPFRIWFALGGAIVLAAVLVVLLFARPGASPASPQSAAPKTLPAVNDSEFRWPIPGEGERLYIGAAEFEQAERLYVAFVLSADNKSIHDVLIRAEGVAVSNTLGVTVTESFSGIYPLERKSTDIRLGKSGLTGLTIQKGEASGRIRYVFTYYSTSGAFPTESDLEFGDAPVAFKDYTGVSATAPSAAQMTPAPDNTTLQAPEETAFYIGYAGIGDETYVYNMKFRDAITSFTDQSILHYVTDAAAQPLIIEHDLIPAGVDGIIVLPYDTEAIRPALQKAEEAGITTIALTMKEAGIDAGYTFMPTDPYLLGKALGERFSQLMDGKGNVVIQCSFLQSSFYQACLQGATEVLSGYPDIHIMEVLTGTAALPDEANIQARAAMEAYGDDLGGILALDMVSMDGCAIAAEDAGLNGKAVVFGYGALSASERLLSSGVVYSFFAEDIDGSAKAAVRLLYEIASGNTIAEGADLGIPGFHNLHVDGNAISGENWVEVK